jgi:cellulose synthase/poly-beta-1,6-N-acetylglucosamine synthase-like glycosyltransferase
VFWFCFWLFVGPALALTVLSLRGERARASYVRRRLAETLENLPPATVIVPVKGLDEGLRQNLAALAALDYPDYELLIVAHSASDIPAGVLPRRARVILAHGRDPNTGEKVQNLVTAVHAARYRSKVFAFADSDGRVNKRWLRALVAPLNEERVGASSGYRWFTPDRATSWTLLRGVWDAVPAGILGPGDNRFAWGGAMAIRREVFFDVEVLRFWKRTISDDYSLSAAVHAAGLTIAYAPGALVPCREQISARGLFSWMRRQMMITRTYNLRQWRLGLVAHLFYCGAMTASVMAIGFGRRLGWFTLVAQLIPGMIKGARRSALAAAALPESKAWFRRYGWVHWASVPLATWIWLLVLVSSAFGCTIEWRGYRYDLKNNAAA